MLRKSSFEFWGKVLPGVNLASVTKINMTRNYQQSCWLDPGPHLPQTTQSDDQILEAYFRTAKDSQRAQSVGRAPAASMQLFHARSVLLPSESQTGAAMEQRAVPQANAICRSQLPKPLTL